MDRKLWHTILGQADQPGQIEKPNPFTVVVHHPDGQSHIRDETLTGVVCRDTAKHWWASFSPA